MPCPPGNTLDRRWMAARMAWVRAAEVRRPVEGGDAPHDQPPADLLRLRAYSTAGCEVTGDLDALMRGRRAVIRETARITITAVPVPPVPAEPVHLHTGATSVAYVNTGPTPPGHPAHLVI